VSFCNKQCRHYSFCTTFLLSTAGGLTTRNNMHFCAISLQLPHAWTCIGLRLRSLHHPTSSAVWALSSFHVQAALADRAREKWECEL